MGKDTLGCWHSLFERVDQLMQRSRQALIDGDVEAGIKMLHKAQYLNQQLVDVLSADYGLPEVKMEESN